ncbi:MAG TPA: hypothetical protein PLN42_06655 [Anaerolineae bacterium]|nr:hypothetical protein [Anaerolineae bacterium]
MNNYPAGLGCRILIIGSQVVYRYSDGHKTYEFERLADVPKAFHEQFREAIRVYGLEVTHGDRKDTV